MPETNWTELGDTWWRTDGLTVIASDSQADAFVVLPKDDRRAISLCPCCERPMRNARAARLIADAVYPMRAS